MCKTTKTRQVTSTGFRSHMQPDSGSTRTFEQPVAVSIRVRGHMGLVCNEL